VLLKKIIGIRKDAMARAVAAETGAYFVINGPEDSKKVGESETNLVTWPLTSPAANADD
jgi:SpoVK/Ycf46/Vps4 family AAA+-type ATPase